MSLIPEGPISTNTTGPIPIVIPPFYCNTYPIAYHYDKYHNCILNSNCRYGPIDIETNYTTVYCKDKVHQMIIVSTTVNKPSIIIIMHLPIQTPYQETYYNIKEIILPNIYYCLTLNKSVLFQVTLTV